ncbi:hypothetical protein C5N14_23675 [Micromonospora sp. MW-13]|uniref:hypothetical protein n=1 Tax=Micromonospora sp. MW-13 TaxID=2094022 RepID=UPI000E440655|nr:hypothetical protein [Micromonospora sp. MW-13]RGC66400.1 hypothetical protein C5N14_23675 [Micromonospora sp. MW-13]
MQKRYVGLLAVMVATACLAVVGALGGGYLADLTTSRSADPVAVTGSAPPAARVTPVATESPDRTSTGSGNADPSPPESPAKEQPTRRTYQIDRLMYEQASMSVTLVSAEVNGGKLRLNLRYRNGSLVPWPVSCPTAAVDLISSWITLADGRIVYPENTWCATTRPGESFSIAPNTQATTWGVYPVVPETGSSFELTWYDFPTLDDIRLR